MNNETQTPAGYMQNPQGHLVPVGSIKKIDKLRNTLVLSIIDRAAQLRCKMQDFNLDLLADIEQYMGVVTLDYQERGKEQRKTKGNFTLTSFDGLLRVQVSINDTIGFDERIQIAKQLIDDYIHDLTKNSDDRVKALIEHSFQTDKAGKISTSRVLGLFKLDFDDPEWHTAMRALRDSLCVASSKSYIRFYQREAVADKFVHISLDMAAL